MVVGQEPHTLEEAMARKNIAKLKDLTARIGCSSRSLTSWLNGSHRPSVYYLGRLSYVLGVDAARFFTQTEPVLSLLSEQPTVLTRRAFVGSLVAVPAAIQVIASPQAETVSANLVEGMIALTQQFRALQRNGVTNLEEGLRGQLAMVTQALETTVSDTIRRDLWRIYTLAQLTRRLGITKESELARAKTLNETAIAAAQRSGDTELIAAMIGHLAHLYLIWQHDTEAARQLIGEAQLYTRRGSPTDGWLTLLQAATAARSGNARECELALHIADDIAHTLPAGATADTFFTDFNLVSVNAFAGNSLILAGAPVKAYERLTQINLGDMAYNRHASTFYDIARAYAQHGELDAAQTYAIQAIDTAVATDRWYIVPRFLSLAEALKQRNPQERHARAITEYALLALQKK